MKEYKKYYCPSCEFEHYIGKNTHFHCSNTIVAQLEAEVEIARRPTITLAMKIADIAQSKLTEVWESQGWDVKEMPTITTGVVTAVFDAALEAGGEDVA